METAGLGALGDSVAGEPELAELRQRHDPVLAGGQGCDVFVDHSFT
jgi:hypothetical protein